jgi:predicted unusual protein kinase regulating ubiquinone biosynthesis (AarF/ABC1/UbiB family)
MATIFIIKQIIDLVCEELSKTKSINSQPESVKQYEEILHRKDEELATLYKENIKLENRIRQIESELDVFSVINPQTKSEDTTEVKNEVVNEPTKQTVESDVKKEEEPIKPKRKRDSEERRQYMKEYGKKYRQRQREKKIEMNL